MKIPIRLQSRLLIRRSYKPGRIARHRLDIAFQPTRPVAVPILMNRDDEQPRRTTPVEIMLSG
jgi:hypothetical protein